MLLTPLIKSHQNKTKEATFNKKSAFNCACLWKVTIKQLWLYKENQLLFI